MTVAGSNGAGVTHADAVVVGAGPAGSAAATFLAEAGHDVVILEKERFPRDKVCGDGLTPRAVGALQRLGLHEEAEGTVDGWDRQSGLRMYGGGVVLDLPWPELDEWPAHSVTATRARFDETLARHAAKAGAQLWEETEVTGPVYLTESRRRVAGVSYRRPDGRTGTVRAPIVIAADGGSSRFAVQLGLARDTSRPMGVAVRAYYRTDRPDLDMMEGFLELRRGMAGEGRGSGSTGELLPGYGWIFPLDDGLLNIGWGLLNTSEHFRSTNYRKTLHAWVAGFPESWGIRADTMVGTPRSAGLPMGHNRHPRVCKGVLLVGDAGGMVNPFNGEGISYAIEAAALAAEACDTALASRSDAALESYATAVDREWGSYYAMGRMFVDVVGHPSIMRLCVEYGMPRREVMQIVFRLMAHLTNSDSRDRTDRLIHALERVVPAS